LVIYHRENLLPRFVQGTKNAASNGLEAAQGIGFIENS
jgi:hypothetical protein